MTTYQALLFQVFYVPRVSRDKSQFFLLLVGSCPAWTWRHLRVLQTRCPVSWRVDLWAQRTWSGLSPISFWADRVLVDVSSKCCHSGLCWGLGKPSPLISVMFRSIETLHSKSTKEKSRHVWYSFRPISLNCRNNFVRRERNCHIWYSLRSILVNKSE